MTRASIHAQLAEAKRQLAMMRIAYPEWLARAAIDENAAKLDVALMEDVVATLAWLAKHEDIVKSVVARELARRRQPNESEAA